VDFGVPSQRDLDRCVAWIDEQIEEGRAVAVHCFAGIGRTGTVLAAWMVAQGMDAEDVITEIRRLRPGSIETEGQAGAVRAFARRRAP
jgi:atypical dual specificity phosphatase